MLCGRLRETRICGRRSSKTRTMRVKAANIEVTNYTSSIDTRVKGRRHLQLRTRITGILKDWLAEGRVRASTAPNGQPGSPVRSGRLLSNKCTTY